MLQLKNPKLYIMIFSDAALFAAALAISYLFRFEFRLHAVEMQQIKTVLIWMIPLKLIVFYGFGLYRGMWRYTSVRDTKLLATASLVSMLSAMAVILYLYRFQGYSRAVFLMDGILTFLFCGSLRLSIRLYFSRQGKFSVDSFHHPSKTPRKKILIVGAGDAGEKILREIMDNEQLTYLVAGFIDDNPEKRGRSIHGVPVLGDVDQLKRIVEEEDIEEVMIAVPSASGEQMRRLVSLCEECRVSFKTLPGIGEIIDGTVSVKVLRDVSYEDLLGRPPVHLDSEGIRNYISGKTVLITGCGGSIGSELCRQVIRFQPGRLVLVDTSEENLFNIQMELQNEREFHDFCPLLADIKNRSLMESVFANYRPAVVFHAAAYKHVPMLEKNPWEAVSNNIVGSRTVMELAVEYGVQRFVLVSTDKAVRPTNVMGASKRVTELMMQSLQENGTRFMAVRFGNVVGSSGSVIPIFRRQIELGGPVTVTHPDVTRYFMTIPEAAQLIIQAGAMGMGGEIFILKMGTPVRIADMARDLIRLSGKEPDRDIEVVFTGLREGEKLFEELITSGEGIVESGHDKIMVLKPDQVRSGKSGIEDFRQWLYREIEQLYLEAGCHETSAIKKRLKKLVPEYIPQETDSVL